MITTLNHKSIRIITRITFNLGSAVINLGNELLWGNPLKVEHGIFLRAAFRRLNTLQVNFMVCGEKIRHISF